MDNDKHQETSSGRAAAGSRRGFALAESALSLSVLVVIAFYSMTTIHAATRAMGHQLTVGAFESMMLNYAEAVEAADLTEAGAIQFTTNLTPSLPFDGTPVSVPLRDLGGGTVRAMASVTSWQAATTNDGTRAITFSFQGTFTNNFRVAGNPPAPTVTTAMQSVTRLQPL